MNRTRLFVAFGLALVALAVMPRTIVAVAGTEPSNMTQTTVAHVMKGVPPNTDPFLWLEQVKSPRALAWVNAQDAKTVAVLEHDPRFKVFSAEALRIDESKTRIPYPITIAGSIYNFWQDRTHVRGILRRTSSQSYASTSPVWTTVLDLDAVAKAEHANWVWEGITCALPREQRCLVFLSDGGEDAVTIREFDLGSDRFFGGFMFSRQKQYPAWEDENTLLISRAWTQREVTPSGYPYDVRELRRGQPLDRAKEIYRGSPSDIDVNPDVYHDGAGHKLTLIERDVASFKSEFYLVGAHALPQLDLPQKVNIVGLVAGRLLVSLNENWTAGGRAFPSGSLISVDLTNVMSEPAHLRPTLVYAPGPRESVYGSLITKDHAIMVVYHNVRGVAYNLTPGAADSWTKVKLSLPDNLSVDLDDSNLRNNSVFLDVNGFLTPTTLFLDDAATNTLSAIKSQPAQFDPSRDIVEQDEATSKDGTKIPYFVVRPGRMIFNGANPTVLYGYGGFQISLTPYYDPNVGKLWLERGGVFVVANIRGGGEFGPAWHEAGLKTHRQRIYDDFYAVARDLVARKVTSPRYLGIQGASNGGLLMGVEFTQHPEMWNAVDIGLPLLDMLRYEQINAGASWSGEYGSISNPTEKAFLASISPYQNIKPGLAYPEPFIWTTYKDDRVGPQHARKFAAKLNAMGVKYLFYEVIEGGHAFGANLPEDAHTTALEWTYFARKLMTDP